MGALALAPISLVQCVIAGGLVLLTVVADRVFGIEVTRREWICVGLTAAGLAFLAATLDGDAASAHSRYDPSTLAIYLVIVGVVGLALVVPSGAPLTRRAASPRLGASGNRPALLAVSAAARAMIKAIAVTASDTTAATLTHRQRPEIHFTPMLGHRPWPPEILIPRSEYLSNLFK